MKHFFSISLCFLALSLSAQETITYPYNPDGDADGLVAVPDLQDILAVYGNPFSPAEIMVGDTALSEWIQILYQDLQDQQAVIDAMQGAGGCDYQFPEGIHGDFVAFNPIEIPYIVPSNKRLYIIQIGDAGSRDFWLNGTWVELDYLLENPLIINENQEISVPQNTGGSGFINGVLVEADNNIEPVWLYEAFLPGTDPYQVPEGKKLVVLCIDNTGYLLLNGINSGHTRVGNNFPILVPELTYISGTGNGPGYLHGYLVDEDYFADCGGGGSSEGDIGSGDLSATIDSLNQVVSNLDSLMQIIIPFFGCTDPTACNYDSMAVIDNSSCSGLQGCTDFLSSNYNSSATCDDGSCIPYVGMYGYGGVVFKVDGSSAYVLNPLVESLGNTSAIFEIANNISTNGYDDWQVPNIDLLVEACEYEVWINLILGQNGGLSFSPGHYSSNEHCQGTYYKFVYSPGCSITDNNDCTSLSNQTKMRTIRIHNY